VSIEDVYAIASGKGGVGKSSVTVNLAAALVAAGRRVGILDADIYGHSVPRMLGMTAEPTQSHGKIVPPAAWGIAVMSMGTLTAGNAPVVLRGPMLHRVLRQFVSDVDWGELDVLLVDLPPGTGDVALSLAELLPQAELLIVTTPQQAAAEVAERAGALAEQTRQRLVGVVENMSWLPCPHCGHRLEVFGSGGGELVAGALGRTLGTPVALLAQIPLDPRLREQCDAGEPLVHADPDSPAAAELRAIAARLAARGGGLAGRSLGLTPVLHRD
jgi:ATP-binding protein involved in chromosome partitioning